MIPWLGYIFHISSLQSYSVFPSFLYIIFWKILVHTAHTWVVRSDAPKASGLLTCIICNSSAWELCLFYILFIQSFIYISMNSWLFILYFGLKSNAVAAADGCCCLLLPAAAKSLQSCPTLCDPTDGSPPGSPVPGILQARTLECVAISFSNVWKWSRSVVSDSQRSHGLQPTRLLHPWDFPGKSTGVGCHCQCYFLYFVIKLFQIWPLGLFHLAPMSIWYPLIIMICVCIYVYVNTSVFRNTRCFRLILYVSSLCPEISHSTRSPGIFYCRMNVASKILNVAFKIICASCLRSGLISRPFWLMEQGNICVYANL